MARSGEGVVYAIRDPDRVVASEVFHCFLVAGLTGTGPGYRVLYHWWEVAARRPLRP